MRRASAAAQRARTGKRSAASTAAAAPKRAKQDPEDADGTGDAPALPPPPTLASIRLHAETFGHPLEWFRKGREVTVHDRMQQGYRYTLAENPGENMDPSFDPAYTPGACISEGVFEGKYLNDCTAELPREWFLDALDAESLSPGRADATVNLLGVQSRQPLQVWRAKGWIHEPDVRGWFQWFCRYWLGRREPELDKLQIKRWRCFSRHAGQIVASYQRMAPSEVPTTRAQKRTHRARQRQGLLQWAYNPWL